MKMSNDNILNGTIINIQYYQGNQKAFQPVLELNVNGTNVPIYLGEQDKQGISVRNPDNSFTQLTNGQEISIRAFEKDGRMTGFKSYIALGKGIPKEFGSGSNGTGGNFKKGGYSGGNSGGNRVGAKKEFDTVGAAVGGAVNAATRVFAVLVEKGEKQANDMATLRAITVDIYNMAESVKTEMKAKEAAQPQAAAQPVAQPVPPPAPAPQVQQIPPQPVAPGVVQPSIAQLTKEVETVVPSGGY